MQYVGLIRHRTSGELVSSYPTVWLCQDGSGGYCRFTTKLRQHNLEFTCQTVPQDEQVLLNTLKKIVDYCSTKG